MDTEDGRWVEAAREIECYEDYQLVNYSSFLFLPPRLCSCLLDLFPILEKKPCTGREMGPDPPHSVTRSCSWSWRHMEPASIAFSYVGLTFLETYQLLWKGESLSSWVWPFSTSLFITSSLLSLGWGSQLSGTWKRLERVIIGYLEVYDGP